ncbi:MAG: hypothetical protein ACR2OO_04060 [Thermomicrobiales bacterium]
MFDGCSEDAVHVEAVSGALSFAGDAWGSCPHPPFDDGTAGVVGTPFRDDAGLIVVEAESAHERVARHGQAWIVESGLAGFVGTGYAKTEWDRGQRYATDYARRSPQLTFTVSFTAAGTYYVWVRMAADSGASDSIHLGLDGQEEAGADNVAAVAADGSWRWASATGDGLPAALVVAAAGTHAVDVWAREDGVAIDRLILTTDAAYVPSGAGPEAGPRLGAAEPGASGGVGRD